jgi:hypothetical protein
VKKPTNPQKARAGRHLVVAALLRRGVGDVEVVDERRSAELVVSGHGGAPALTITVKTKTTGTWRTTTTLGESRASDPNESRFWVLVDIGTEPAHRPTYFVVWWMRNYIHEEIPGHLARHGGKQPVTADSTHCAIKPRDVEPWCDRWDLLGAA